MTKRNTHAGKKQKETGLHRVTVNNLKWLSLMRRAGQQVAIKRGVVCADDLRGYACELEQQGIVPTHSNAWGAIFRSPLFVCVGCVVSQYPSNHARCIRLWQLRKQDNDDVK